MNLRRLAPALALLWIGCPRTPPAPPPLPAAPAPPVALPVVHVTATILAPRNRVIHVVPDDELPRVAALWLALLEGDGAVTPTSDGGLRLNRTNFLPAAFTVFGPDHVLREVNGKVPAGLAELRDLLRASPPHRLTAVVGRRGVPTPVEFRPASKRPPPATRESLAAAVKENAVDRLREALDWGADPDPAHGLRPLVLAVLLRRVETARLLLEAGSVLRRDGEDSLLLEVLRKEKIDPALVSLLLKHGADPNETDPADGRTALVMAAWAPPAPALPVLVEAGAKLDVPDRSGHTALTICAGRRDAESVRLLLDKGADPNLRFPLHRAIEARRGGSETIRILLERGADVGRRENGTPALVRASLTGEIDVLNLLLDKGADPDARTRTTVPMTALETAAASGSKEAVDLLLRRGATVTGWALVSAAKQGHVELVKTLAPTLPARDLSTALAAAKDAAAAALRELGAKDLRGAPGGADRDLFSAIRGGSGEDVEKALAAGADLRARDKDGRTPLLAAVDVGRLEAARLLLDKGARVDDADVHGQTALWRAAERGEAGVVRILLDRGADPGVRAWGMSILERIEGYGHPHIEFLLRAKGAPGARTDYAPPAKLYKDEAEARADQDLIQGVYRGDPARAQSALDRGADPNARGRNFLPVLYAAAQAGQAELLILLLGAGADVNAPADPEGHRPLHAALHRGPAIVKLLLGAGADVDVATSNGETPLMKAFPSASEAAALEMIDRSRNVNARSRFGQTALSAALASPECVARLLDKGADPDAADNEGKTVLMTAAERGWTEIARLLLDKKARCDLVDRGPNRWAALHYAAASGRSATVRLLVERGAAVAQPSGRGEHPIDLARRGGHAEVAAFLRDPGSRR